MSNTPRFILVVNLLGLCAYQIAANWWPSILDQVLGPGPVWAGSAILVTLGLIMRDYDRHDQKKT